MKKKNEEATVVITAEAAILQKLLGEWKRKIEEEKKQKHKQKECHEQIYLCHK